MTVKEARDSFDRMLETAKQESIVLRDDKTDIAMVVPPDEFARFRQWQVGGLTRVMDRISTEAAANGLTEERLAELLNQKD